MTKNEIGEEEIQKYINILDTYKKSKRKKEIVESHSHKLEPYMGQWLCVECGLLKGHILGQYDINDFDRLHYQKKSIYHRKYYFEKKVKNIKKIINLDDSEACQLYEELLEMDNNFMVELNKKYNRKRMININYIIQRFLEEMGCEKYKNIKLKISSEILKIYNDWWSSYKEMIK